MRFAFVAISISSNPSAPNTFRRHAERETTRHRSTQADRVQITQEEILQ
jgi:hypothetical protein